VLTKFRKTSGEDVGQIERAVRLVDPPKMLAVNQDFLAFTDIATNDFVEVLPESLRGTWLVRWRDGIDDLKLSSDRTTVGIVVRFLAFSPILITRRVVVMDAVSVETATSE
jgi:hypothetical protein